MLLKCGAGEDLDSSANQSILKEVNSEFIARTDAEAPTLWPPDAKSQLTGKDPDDGKD